jgi:hypothetical protein
MKLTLSVKEVALLMKNPETRYALQRALLGQVKSARGADIFLDASEADHLRDACGDLLQRIGFDESYALTQEGDLLESLIDKLFFNSAKGVQQRRGRGKGNEGD